ncbi:MAG: hypothetical protein KGL53_02900, partial [Elusimicrobia bacterium]|nr:hypothetical protein [Elusimicrobiota bacterium]
TGRLIVGDDRAARALFVSAGRMDDWRARKACAEALGRATPKVEATLRDALAGLDDPREDVVRAALGTLAALGSFAAEAVPKVLRWLQKGRYEYLGVIEAVTALEMIGSRPELCVPALRALLTRWSDEDILCGRDCGAVHRAYRALGAFSDARQEVIPPLLDALSPERRRLEHLVAQPALASLARLGAPASEVLPRVRALWEAILAEDDGTRPVEAGLARLMGGTVAHWREKEPEAFRAAFAGFPPA